MYKCKECGARLDPCEKCDCVIQKQMLETIKNEIECREELIRILSSEIKTIYNNLKENK